MDLTFPPALCFRVMNQLLTLTGTWRKGGGQKKMLQQLDVHADAHAGGLGGRSLHAQGPCGVRSCQESGRAWKEQPTYVALFINRKGML